MPQIELASIALRFWFRRRWRWTRLLLWFLPSAIAVANERHSTYGFRYATISYPWHPLFGCKVQVSRYRRGKTLMCIYTDERPDHLSRELPNWMFDESYCSGMRLGSPEISIDGLNELGAALASFGEARVVPIDHQHVNERDLPQLRPDDIRHAFLLQCLDAS